MHLFSIISIFKKIKLNVIDLKKLYERCFKWKIEGKTKFSKGLKLLHNLFYTYPIKQSKDAQIVLHMP